MAHDACRLSFRPSIRKIIRNIYHLLLLIHYFDDLSIKRLKAAQELPFSYFQSLIFRQSNYYARILIQILFELTYLATFCATFPNNFEELSLSKTLERLFVFLMRLLLFSGTIF